MIEFSNVKYAAYIVPAGFITLLFFLIYAYMRRRIIRAVTGLHHKNVQFISGSYAKLSARELLVCLAVVFLVVAMLGPGWGEEEREKRSEGSDLVVALDVSRSMLATDALPTRLERAKSAIKLMAGSLDGDRIGLILFSGDAFLQCPLTADTGALMMFLDSAGPDSINIEGTDMGRMFEVALGVFEKKRLTSKMLVVITDGEDHEGGAADAADKLKREGISVYVFCIGGESGEYIPIPGRNNNDYYRDREGALVRTSSNPSLLKKISDETGGSYSDITKSFSGIETVTGAVDRQQKKSTGVHRIKEKKDRSWIFILLAVMCMCAEICLNQQRRIYAER